MSVPAPDLQDNYDLGELERNLTALGPVATEEFCNLLSSPLGDAEVECENRLSKPSECLRLASLSQG